MKKINSLIFISLIFNLYFLNLSSYSKDFGNVQTRTISINSQTGTSYTLVLSDAGKLITMNNAASNTVTIPANSSVSFPVGTIIIIDQIGAGTTTIQGDTGVTVNGTSAGSASITAQYQGVSLKKIATDIWIIQGGI